jgi:hypothetical protein
LEKIFQEKNVQQQIRTQLHDPRILWIEMFPTYMFSCFTKGMYATIQQHYSREPKIGKNSKEHSNEFLFINNLIHALQYIPTKK